MICIIEKQGNASILLNISLPEQLQISIVLAGTTCATILTRAIYTEGCKSVAAGMNAMDLRRGITMAVDSVVTNLKSRARMISTSEEIAQVCLLFSGLSCKALFIFDIILFVPRI